MEWSVTMAVFWCRCGERLWNGADPNLIQYTVYSDPEWINIINLIDDGLKEWTDLPYPTYDVWRCPECERVYVFDGDNVIKQYVLED